MRQDGRVAGIGGCGDELQRPIGGSLKVVGGHKRAVPLLHESEAWMGVGEVELSARRQDGRNDACPGIHVPKPANGAPGGKDQVKRPRRQARGIVNQPWTKSACSPVSSDRLRATRKASPEKSRPVARAPRRTRHNVSRPM